MTAMKRRTFLSRLKKLWIIPAVLAVALLFTWAVEALGRDGGEQGRKNLEEGLRRAAVTCYALEGSYPPNVDYLKTYYGVQIDESRYSVFYEVFAENLMPEITVVELK